MLDSRGWGCPLTSQRLPPTVFTSHQGPARPPAWLPPPRSSQATVHSSGSRLLGQRLASVCPAPQLPAASWLVLTPISGRPVTYEITRPGLFDLLCHLLLPFMCPTTLSLPVADVPASVSACATCSVWNVLPLDSYSFWSLLKCPLIRAAFQDALQQNSHPQPWCLLCTLFGSLLGPLSACACLPPLHGYLQEGKQAIPATEQR